MQPHTSSDRLIQGGGLATAFTRLTNAQALDLAQIHYGITGRVNRFDTEKDDTFRIENDQGTRYVLKIANPDETEQEIDLQLTVLEHVATKDPDFPAPRVQRSLHGERMLMHGGPGGEQRLIRMLSYLDGIPLSDTTCTQTQREQIGEILARLRLAMSDISHPIDTRELAWDVKHLGQLAPLAEHIDNSSQQQLLMAGLQRFFDIEPQLSRLRTQVLHNDFSQSNIVVDHDHATFITGIIDFGDVVRTAVAIDVSTALLNQLPRQYEEDLFSDGRDVVRGYLRVADLGDDELALIPHLVMARVIARALITTWRARVFPDNAQYILRNTPPGWDQLKWILSRSMDDVSDTLLAATR